MTSGDKIRFFLEEDAVTGGQLNRAKELAVNKMGHGTSPLIRPHSLGDIDPPNKASTNAIPSSGRSR